MKDIGWTLAPMVAAGLLLIALGCGKDVQSPSDVESAPALATAQTLVFRVVSTGTFHTCGVTTSDVAYCWGYNLYGALGDGTNIGKGNPVPVLGGLHFSLISAGEYHTCGITTSGKAYCWGQNDEGQLGDGTITSRSRPVAVKGGLVFRQIRPGSQFTCGATSSDKGYCWGSNRYGRLGIASIDAGRLAPTPVAGGLAFRRVIAGGTHACGLTPVGKAYCWGRNVEGQIGIGQTVVRRLAPNAVVGGLTFTQVVPGYYHTCGVTTGKRAYCWGLNNSGQLGDGTPTDRLRPTLVAEGHPFIGVSPAFARTCGISSDARMWCWGWNQYGELGVDPRTANHLFTPVQIPGLNFSTVAGGLAAHHTCGVTPTGTAYCWGYGLDGQTGDGSLSSGWVPQQVSPPI
jgi:alpha-tubulin suppressor-like RCC1 family protein